jgi:hypothetical protein
MKRGSHLMIPSCNRLNWMAHIGNKFSGANNFALSSTGTCTPLLSNGASIPNEPGHTPNLNGICNPAAAALVCQLGVCDVKDNKCGFGE